MFDFAGLGAGIGSLIAAAAVWRRGESNKGQLEKELAECREDCHFQSLTIEAQQTVIIALRNLLPGGAWSGPPKLLERLLVELAEGIDESGVLEVTRRRRSDSDWSGVRQRPRDAGTNGGDSGRGSDNG